jgi:hydrogenase-4 component H
MKLPCLLQPRILRQALGALFSKPFTTRFPAEPYTPIASFRGRVRFDEAGCIGCGACAQVCPAKCIDVIDEVDHGTPRRTLIQHLDACIWCGQCVRYCVTEAGIRMTSEYVFVGFAPADFEERVEKELLLCEVCGGVIAPVDQIRWLIRRLGPLAYANPTLMMTAARDLRVADEPARPEGDEVLRGQRVSIQCPKCRRKTAWAA